VCPCRAGFARRRRVNRGTTCQTAASEAPTSVGPRPRAATLRSRRMTLVFAWITTSVRRARASPNVAYPSLRLRWPGLALARRRFGRAERHGAAPNANDRREELHRREHERRAVRSARPRASLALRDERPGTGGSAPRKLLSRSRTPVLATNGVKNTSLGKQVMRRRRLGSAPANKHRSADKHQPGPALKTCGTSATTTTNPLARSSASGSLFPDHEHRCSLERSGERQRSKMLLLAAGYNSCVAR
jgi:hypothetical protein